MQVMAKPGLQRWKDERLIDACMMYADKIPTEISCDYDFARIKAGEIARNAADEGTKIHAAIERFLQGKWIDTKYEAHVDAAIRECEFYVASDSVADRPKRPVGRGAEAVAMDRQTPS